jgi:hypothetical protein
MDGTNLTRSLNELEGGYWPEPDDTDTRLVEEIHRLRSVPIGQMTTEDLRLLLGQQIGTEWLMPLALERLERDPLAEGDFYPGDLLMGVLRTQEGYWPTHPEPSQALKRVRLRLLEISDVPDRLLSDASGRHSTDALWCHWWTLSEI